MSFRVDKAYHIPTTNTPKKDNSKSKGASNLDFQSVLNKSIDAKKPQRVKISTHAQQRMDERHIRLERDDIKVLQTAMNDLEKKGSRESLMLYKDMAFIASINNRTIITAMKEREVEIVTNIDSTMVIK